MWSSEKTIAVPAQNRSTSSRQIVKTAGMLFGNLDSVVFDPKIDCPPLACYNCWSYSHYRRYCREPESRNFCCNCGRRDVRVDECARCARAFFEQDDGLKSWIIHHFLASNAPGEKLRGDAESRKDGKAREDRKQSGDFGSESPPAYTEPNGLFAYMRARKVDDDGVNLDDTMMAERQSFDEDSVIFDVAEEEQRGEQESPRGEPIHDFMNLMDAVKHLSVATQEVVVLQLMAERKRKSAMYGSVRD